MVRRAAEDSAESTYAIALSGVGMSTESGIPDSGGPRGCGSQTRRQRLGLIKGTAFS